MKPPPVPRRWNHPGRIAGDAPIGACAAGGRMHGCRCVKGGGTPEARASEGAGAPRRSQRVATCQSSLPLADGRCRLLPGPCLPYAGRVSTRMPRVLHVRRSPAPLPCHAIACVASAWNPPQSTIRSPIPSPIPSLERPIPFPPSLLQSAPVGKPVVPRVADNAGRQRRHGKRAAAQIVPTTSQEWLRPEAARKAAWASSLLWEAPRKS